jgi:hypothetical protein
MNDLCAKISQDIFNNCIDKPVKGIKQRLMLINSADLPLTGINFSSTVPSSLIEQLTLAAGKRAFEIQGLKQIMKFTNTGEFPEDSNNGVIHSISGIRFQDPSELIRAEINNFLNGANVYAVLHRNWTGEENKQAFLFFGLKFGLEASELIEDSGENDGTSVLSLSTPSGFSEPYMPHIFRDTDYATSLTAFNNKFASA